MSMITHPDIGDILICNFSETNLSEPEIQKTLEKTVFQIHNKSVPALALRIMRNGLKSLA